MERDFRAQDAEVVALYGSLASVAWGVWSDHRLNVWDSNSFQLVETSRIGPALPIQL